MTDATAYLLSQVNQELHEAGKLLNKSIQHGVDSRDPETGKTNLELLVGELNDIFGAVDLLHDHLAANGFDNETALLYSKVTREEKMQKILKWAEITRSNGRLEADPRAPSSSRINNLFR